MEQIAQSHEARDLLDLAEQLRQSAFETADENYVLLFLNAAMALEARATSINHGLPRSLH